GIRTAGAGRVSLRVCFTGSDPFKKRDCLWLVVDFQRELVGSQTIDETTFLIENHYVSLHQFGVDTNDIRLVLGIRRFGLGVPRRCGQKNTGKPKQKIAKMKTGKAHSIAY